MTTFISYRYKLHDFPFELRSSRREHVVPVLALERESLDLVNVRSALLTDDDNRT